MRIVVDLQGAQCGSRSRGIGRYSLSLAQAMVRNRGSNEVLIVLNGMFPETIEPISAAFDGLCSRENIHVWHAESPVNANDSANTWRRHTAEFIREAFLASLKPDIIHVSSLMEGFGDNAVHSIGILNTGIPTAVTFYDLIPLIQSEVYLTPNPNFEILYREKLGHLNRANLYLAISESSRLEAIKYISTSEDEVVNISAAADECFKPTSLSDEKKHALLKKFKLNRPFLMCSGATDERKNHIRLIKAFSLLPLAIRKSHQLGIVGGLSFEHEKQFEDQVRLCGLGASDVVITGRVTDEEMVALYNLSTLCVFPSWHEGFGLPALEAMSCGCPVICSNNTSLPEIVGRDDALFDPFDEKSMAAKMEEVLVSEDLRVNLAQHSLKQAKLFSWDKSGQLVIAALERLHKKQLTKNSQKTYVSDKNSTSWLIESIAGIRESSLVNLPDSQQKRLATNNKAQNSVENHAPASTRIYVKILIGIFMVIFSVPIILMGVLLIFCSGFTKNKTRAHAGTRALNHFVNAAIFKGNAWETVASHAWRMRERPWAKTFIRFANYVQPDHCFRANKRGQPVVDFVTRQGLDKPTMR
jgi:glycosyltransferase involved in cell wall biosynthesis